MAGLARARSLHVQIQVGDDNILEGLSCPFNVLKSLTLDTSLSLLSSVLSVFCLLRNAPKLKICILRSMIYFLSVMKLTLTFRMHNGLGICSPNSHVLMWLVRRAR